MIISQLGGKCTIDKAQGW